MWFNHSSPRSSPKRNETICAYEEPAMTIPSVICKNPNLEITRTSVNRQKDKHRCTSHTKESESTGRMYCWHTETLMDHKVTFFFSESKSLMKKVPTAQLPVYEAQENAGSEGGFTRHGVLELVGSSIILSESMTSHGQLCTKASAPYICPLRLWKRNQKGERKRGRRQAEQMSWAITFFLLKWQALKSSPLSRILANLSILIYIELQVCVALIWRMKGPRNPLNNVPSKCRVLLIPWFVNDLNFCSSKGGIF